MMERHVHELLLYSKLECHLCESARQAIESVIQETPDLSFTEITLDEGHPLYERYSELFPVIVLDGREVAYWRIDRRTIMSAIEESV